MLFPSVFIFTFCCVRSQEGLAAATEQKREEAMLQENDYDRLVKAFAFEDRCRPTVRPSLSLNQKVFHDLFLGYRIA